MTGDKGRSGEPRLFRTPLQVVNLGIEEFAETLREQSVPVVEVAWQPPAGGNPGLAEILKQMYGAPEKLVRTAKAGVPAALVDRIDAANREAIDRILKSRPQIVDVAPAGEAMGLPPRTILHAGPPVPWERMAGPQKRGVIGAIQLEGWAANAAEAEAMVAGGQISLSPAHRYSAVGPMTGIVSPSMPVLVARNETFGNYGFSTFNEGRGDVMWFGIVNDATLSRLRWMRDTLAPAVRAAIQKKGPIDVFDVVAQGLQMGDDCHARSAACTATLFKTLIPSMLEAGVAGDVVASIGRFMADNSHFFLNFTMAGVKATMDAAHGIPYSTLVTAISRNGMDCMVRVSGLGDRWAMAPVAKMTEALYYTGYSVADAAGDIGDSAIIETCGIGGMAIAAAPSMAIFVGGSLKDEIAAVRELRSIVLAEHPKFTLPTMGFEGTPLGMDLRKVVETRIVPFITTGVLHETSATVGQIGTGVARIPIEAFDDALVALAGAWGLDTEARPLTHLAELRPEQGVR